MIRHAKTPPLGFVSIKGVFDRALVRYYPEHHQEGEWPLTKSGPGWNLRTIPPELLLGSWRTRSRYGRMVGELSKNNWRDHIVFDTAYRLYEAARVTKVPVCYYDNQQKREFLVPPELLTPLSQRNTVGAPWVGGKIADLLKQVEFAHLSGAACFLSSKDEIVFWNALLLQERDANGQKLDTAVTGKAQSKLDLARMAIRETYGWSKRPSGLSQEAVYAAVNVYLDKHHYGPVSKDTVIRALGDRE